ncbi:UvrB/UvrC motif-containing protein [Aneurinibacillus sp. Ricciae_BoGa-3]|uniref:UvrB/UvrC motif-containing protein n=1 Tax=Aneurinibacillus sp. Ricciae_BoGa-3 TaxID=3022697 RepID=UPI0023423794|nr:UvrB/UvrC motif-containing protein [Aneurinibacillus sp. Ricciae_BoGa-3]WCK54660.1 UvrB/UvrC motif-containing protein [Aneurinibacillus sp. Ricciae_BoGa-3]
MICQECKKRPATLHFTKIVNGEKTESHLCEVCAQDKGEMFPGAMNNFSIHNLLSGLLNHNGESAGELHVNQEQTLRCNNCGLTYKQFSKSGRFGCSNCYSAFESKLDPLFRRIHGNTHHSGKVPERSGGSIKLKKQVEELKKSLQRCIEHEEFEEAAKIRDRIRGLENKIAEL